MREHVAGASPWKQALLVAGVAGVGPVVGLIVSWITTLGRSVNPDFFFALATAGPLVGLALFIDLTVVINQAIDRQGSTPANRALGRVLVYSNACLLLLSESLALYALGAEVRTTFLVATSAAPLVLQVLLLTESALYKMRAYTLSAG
jgi:zinc transporter ZupT